MSLYPYQRTDVGGPGLRRVRHDPVGALRTEELSRVSPLTLHAFVGLAVGALTLAVGLPVSSAEAAPWARPVLGTLGLLGGAVLLYGSLAAPTRPRTQLVGVLALVCWTVGMAVTRLLGSDLFSGAVAPSVPWGHDAVPDSTGLFPAVVYLGLLGMLLIHLLTLLRLAPSDGAAVSPGTARSSRR